MTDLAEIIRRKQDQIRGRPRNWKDDLSDWWRDLDFVDDVIWKLFGLAVFAYAIFAVSMVFGFVLGFL